MARTSTVDYDRVAKACYELFQAGEPVSFQRVYDQIGNRGSSRVVNDLIRRWRQEAGDKLAVSFSRNLPGLPEELVATADTLLVQLWQGALASAEMSYHQAQQELEAERAEMQTWRQQVEADRQEQREAVARQEAELAAARTALSEKERALDELKTDHQEQQTQLREQAATIAVLREENARLSATLEATQRQHAADLGSAQERAEALLSEARQSAAGERVYLMRTTDEIRQAAKNTETQLREEIAGLRAQADLYRGRANQANDEAARLRGRVEAIEAELARQRETLQQDLAVIVDLRSQLAAAGEKLRDMSGR